jgi:hypothetical protein
MEGLSPESFCERNCDPANYKRWKLSGSSSHNSLNCFQISSKTSHTRKNEIRKLILNARVLIHWILSLTFYFNFPQILAVAFLAVALAAPQGDKKPIEIVSYNSEMNADGSYSFE